MTADQLTMTTDATVVRWRDRRWWAVEWTSDRVWLVACCYRRVLDAQWAPRAEVEVTP